MRVGNVNPGFPRLFDVWRFASFGGDTRLDNLGRVGLISQSGGTMVSLNFLYHRPPMAAWSL